MSDTLKVQISKLSPKDGDLIIITAGTDVLPIEKLQTLHSELVGKIKADACLLRLLPGVTLETLEEKDFARIAHARGYYKAEPSDHIR